MRRHRQRFSAGMPAPTSLRPCRWIDWRCFTLVISALAKQLKELEKENTRLKKLVADQALDIQILKEAS